MKKGTEFPTVAEKRNYMVLDVAAAKKIALLWLQAAKLENAVDFGLPEVDDRYHVWRVPLVNKVTRERIGEVVIDARTSLIVCDKTTSVKSLETRLSGRVERAEDTDEDASVNEPYQIPTMRDTVALGDSEEIICCVFLRS